MKKTLIAIGLVTLLSCTSQKKILNSWIGQSEQSLIQNWGPPQRTESDGSDGKILVYARQVYLPNINVNYWDYKMMYVHADGTIYSWLMNRQPVPPQQVIVTFR